MKERPIHEDDIVRTVAEPVGDIDDIALQIVAMHDAFGETRRAGRLHDQGRVVGGELSGAVR